jgi:hypothetical protein
MIASGNSRGGKHETLHDTSVSGGVLSFAFLKSEEGWGRGRKSAHGFWFVVRSPGAAVARVPANGIAPIRIATAPMTVISCPPAIAMGRL